MGHRWLVKSEPSVYSIDDLRRDKTTLWDGVRNYQARNLLRDEFKKGDLVLFYHSNEEPVGVAGLAVVHRVDIVDPTQFEKKSQYYDPKANKTQPRWYAPEIKFKNKFDRIVTLAEMRQVKALQAMGLLKKGNRLSVQPLSDIEFETILEMAKSK
ncbi:MAG: EVE domain-containing protein [Bdellovibrionales bacterium]|nr:EVE domain-containing protein [Bdellovibrionales bacterium]